MKRFWCFVFSVLYLLMLFPLQADAASSTILFSEVQIGGTVSTDEFIELYNKSESPLSLENWSVKKRTKTGTESSLVSSSHFAGKSIPAHGFFLIAHQNFVLSGSIVPDILYPSSYSISADNSLLLLDGSGQTVDLVGWGAASSFETAPFPQNPPNNESISRKKDGDGVPIDTDDNNSNFEILTTSTPKNSSAPADPAFSGSTPDPQPQETDTTAPNEVSNLATLSGSGEVTLSWQNPNSGDVAAILITQSGGGVQVFLGSPIQTMISGLENGISYSFLVQTKDSSGNTSTGVSISATPEAPFIPTFGSVLINEVVTDPQSDWSSTGFDGRIGSGAITDTDEFIEFFNPTAHEIDLSGWQLAMLDSSPEIHILGSGMTISPGGILIIGNPDGAMNNIIDLQLQNNNGALIDEVSLGYGSIVDGNAASFLDESLSRMPNGGSAWQKISATPNVKNTFSLDLRMLSVSSNPPFPLGGSGIVTLSALVENRSESQILGFSVVFSVSGSEIGTVTGGTLGIGERQTVSLPWTPNNTGTFLITATSSFSGDEKSDNNTASLEVTVGDHLLLSEFIPDPAGTDTNGEWIELKNPLSGAVDLNGWTIENGSERATLSGSLAAHSYGVMHVVSSSGSMVWSGSWPTMGNSSGLLQLKNVSGVTVDEYSYSGATEGVSFGRSVAEKDMWRSFFHPTFGGENSEQNQAPIATITLQGSRKTSGDAPFSLNITGEASTDPDGDLLSYSWDFGDGGTFTQANPGIHSYGTASGYTVRLMVTDPFGATGSALLPISVLTAASGGAGSTRVAADPLVPEKLGIGSVPASLIDLRITKIDLEGDPDNIELTCTDCGSYGYDLGGYSLADDQIFVTIPQGIFVKTGEHLLVRFQKREDLSDILVPKQKGLSATDSQLLLRDGFGIVEDGLCWTDGNEKLAKSEKKWISAFLKTSIWKGDSIDSCVDVSELLKNESLVRLDATKYEESAWRREKPEIQMIPKKEKTPQKPQKQEKISVLPLVISEIFPNPKGKDEENEWVEIENRNDSPVPMTGFSLQVGKKQYIFSGSGVLASHDFFVLLSQESRLSLKNSSGSVIFRDPNGDILERVEYPKVKENASWGRIGTGFSISYFPTPGFANIEAVSAQREELWKDLNGDKIPDLMESSNNANLDAYLSSLSNITSASFPTKRAQSGAIVANPETLKISGQTVPFGSVELELHSQLIRGLATADENGYWEFTPPEPLEQGQHTLSYFPVDPLGNEGKVVQIAFSLPSPYIPKMMAKSQKIKRVKVKKESVASSKSQKHTPVLAWKESDVIDDIKPNLIDIQLKSDQQGQETEDALFWAVGVGILTGSGVFGKKRMKKWLIREK